GCAKACGACPKRPFLSRNAVLSRACAAYPLVASIAGPARPPRRGVKARKSCRSSVVEHSLVRDAASEGTKRILEVCCRSSVVEHSLGRLPARPETIGSAPPKFGETVRIGRRQSRAKPERIGKV